MEEKVQTLVVIGCGQMGGAIVRGLEACGALEGVSVHCVDVDADAAEGLAHDVDGVIGVEGADAPRTFLIAVKPRYVEEVLTELEVAATDHVISIAAGIPFDKLRVWAGPECAIVRTMPNTPCLVGEGVTGIFGEDAQALEVATEMFEAVGRVVRLDREGLFDALTAISGSGPAYVFTMLEALADGGVLMGLDRRTARTLAVETVRGAAALAAADEAHTAELKDRVASPAGTTIAALRTLEAGGFRDTLINAVEAAARRSKELGE